MDQSTVLHTLLWASIVAASAPLVSALVHGLVPQVVVLLVGGVLIGPHALDVADPADLSVLADVGLGFLFLIAGYEVEPRLFREREGRRAGSAWLGSAALAALLVGGLAAVGFVHAFLAVAIALTTTALGVLLPILRDGPLASSGLAPAAMANGAVGEILPVLAVALLLGSRGQFAALASLGFVAAFALVMVVVPRRLRGGWLHREIRSHQDSTSQASVRATVVLLMVFLVVAARFGLDTVLGAFLAGVVLRQLDPVDPDKLQHKLDVLGYGFFIPLFFIASGMTLDLGSIAAAPQRLLVFAILLLVVRAVPVHLAFRGLHPVRERVALGLLAATSLPLLVAITHLAVENGTMLPANAAALIGAGSISVLLFPAAATALLRRRPGATPEGVAPGTEARAAGDFSRG